MAHQGDRRGFNSDIAAAAHGDPDIRLGQRRGVVNPIANHRHFVPLALQTLNGIGFTVRQHAGDHFINAGFFGDSLRGGGVIPGKHHQPVALPMQTRQGVDAVFTQRVADGEQRGGLTIHRQQHRRGAA